MTIINTLIFLAVMVALVFVLTRSKDFEKMRKDNEENNND